MIEWFGWMVLSQVVPGMVTARERRLQEKPPTVSALDEAMTRLTGGRTLRDSDSVTLDVPEIAEDGAIVPVTVETTLPEVATIALLVEKNPVPLVARFEFDRRLDPYVSLRIKMNETSDVIAVIESSGSYYSARKSVRVVAGGCG